MASLAGSNTIFGTRRFEAFSYFFPNKCRVWILFLYYVVARFKKYCKRRDDECYTKTRSQLPDYYNTLQTHLCCCRSEDTLSLLKYGMTGIISCSPCYTSTTYTILYVLQQFVAWVSSGKCVCKHTRKAFVLSGIRDEEKFAFTQHQNIVRNLACGTRPRARAIEPANSTGRRGWASVYNSYVINCETRSVVIEYMM